MLLTSGCAGFSREWREAGQIQSDSAAITGRWEGHWLSHKNRHTGRLRCLVTELPDGRLRNHFHARFWGVFSATYKIEVQASTNSNGVVSFSGEKDLGWLYGGVYSHQGTAMSTNFSATYTSQIDHGIFELKRP